MRRTCDGTDSYLADADGNPCACGMTFDDVIRSTMFPHLQLPERMTVADLDAWAKQWKEDEGTL